MGQHGGVETSLHWVLDATLSEDRARQSEDHGPESLAWLRKLALNVAQLKKSKGSIKGRRKRAGWSNDCLT